MMGEAIRRKNMPIKDETRSIRSRGAARYKRYTTTVRGEGGKLNIRVKERKSSHMSTTEMMTAITMIK